MLTNQGLDTIVQRPGLVKRYQSKFTEKRDANQRRKK